MSGGTISNLNWGKGLIWLVALTFSVLAPLSAETTLSGDLTGSVETEPDADTGTELDFRFRGRLETWQGDAGLAAEVFLLAPVLNPEGTGLTDTRLRLGECYGDWNSPGGDFRFGWQVIRWGNSLALPVADIVTPADYRGQFTGSGREDYFPVPALRWRLDTGRMQFEALWVLQFIPAEVPGEGAALLPDGVYYGGRELPEASLASTEGGGRIRWFSPVGDFGLSVFYGFDDLPVTETGIELVEGVPTPVFRAGYRRNLMTALDAAVPVGEFLFRAEAACFWGKGFSREGLGLDPVDREELAGQLGIEWMPGDFRFVVEATGSWIPRREDDFTAEAAVLTVAGEAAWSFADDRWELAVSGFYETGDGEWYLKPSLTILPADGFKVLIGGHILGKNGGMLELYETGQRLFVEAVYTF
jgi:hypothetical protein